MKTAKCMPAVALVLLALFAPRTVKADSIAYQFNGTLLSPVNGTTSITGTFTVDSVTGNLLNWDLIDGSLAYTPSDSVELTQFPGVPAIPGPGNILFSFGTQNQCVTAGSSCGNLALQFTYGQTFGDLLNFQPGQPGSANSGACFATVITFLGLPGCMPSPFGNIIQTISGFQSGSVTAVTAVTGVPEPSALALLATGLLGLVGAARKLRLGV